MYSQVLLVKKQTAMAKKQKIYVLDTSVLLHDHHSLINFKKSDVAIPITVLEESDKFKVGNDIKNFAAREVIRSIDKIAGTGNLQSWVKLGGSDLGCTTCTVCTVSGLLRVSCRGSKNDGRLIF
jgi:PhoH-like ATPase